jgi:hypothetical protein
MGARLVARRQTRVAAARMPIRRLMMRIPAAVAARTVRRVDRVVTLGIPPGSPRSLMEVMAARYLPRPRRIVSSWAVVVVPEPRTTTFPSLLVIVRAAVAVELS